MIFADMFAPDQPTTLRAKIVGPLHDPTAGRQALELAHFLDGLGPVVALVTEEDGRRRRIPALSGPPRKSQRPSPTRWEPAFGTLEPVPRGRLEVG